MCEVGLLTNIMLQCKTDSQTLLEVLEFRNCLKRVCFLLLKQRIKMKAIIVENCCRENVAGEHHLFMEWMIESVGLDTP